MGLQGLIVGIVKAEDCEFKLAHLLDHYWQKVPYFPLITPGLVEMELEINS